MATTEVRNSYYSSTIGGMKLLEEQNFTSFVGDQTINLVKTPIEPGEYKMEIGTDVGDVKIHLPNYVQHIIDRGSGMGDLKVHEGLGFWQGMKRTMMEKLHIPHQIPDHAVAPVDPERPVTIHFLISTGSGDVNIYRLSALPP